MSLFEELRRRNVIRVGIAYVLFAWLFLQAADFGLDLIDAPNWVIQTLFLLAAIGLPAVLVFSWVYEMTPEGLKREHEVDRTRSITTQTGQKLNRVIIAVLSLVIVVLLLERFMGTPPSPGEPPAIDTAAEAQPGGESPVSEAEAASVAVLPFTNMSNDPDNEYFSDGLTETLLHMLAQLPELRVAARTSSFAFKGTDAGIEEIAGTLNVAHILEGSVQKAGDRVRVTAQLIRADDGFHVWSQNYTRPLEDIFAIQDEIATDVARALDSSLLGGSESLHGVETRNMSAYETYLKALEQQALFSYASLPAADSLFKEALALDPDFVDAKLGLARNQFKMMNTGLLTIDNAWIQSEPLLQQVLMQDPDNVNARVISLAYKTWLTAPVDLEDVREGIDDLRNLLPLAPTESFIRSSTALVVYYRLNDPDTALALLDAGLLIDPLEPDLLSTRGKILAETDRFDEAETYLLKALSYRPEDANILADMADLKQKTGNLTERLDWLRRATVVDPRDHELAGEIAEILYALDLAEEGDLWARRVFSQAPQSAVGRKIALLQARARGDDQHAIELARSMIEDEISLRHGSLGSAIFGYADLMSTAGRDREGLAFFEEHYPAAMAFDGEALELVDALALFASLQWLHQTLDQEALTTHWNQATRTFDQSLPRWRENPNNVLVGAVLTGDRDEAVRIAQEEVFTRPVSRHLRLDALFELPAMAALSAEPDIQASLAQYERRKAALGDEVRDMLLQPEWND